MIDEKAQDLGRLLGQSEEYKALLRASQRLKEDAETQKLLEEVERLAEAIEGAAQPRLARSCMHCAPFTRIPSSETTPGVISQQRWIACVSLASRGMRLPRH